MKVVTLLSFFLFFNSYIFAGQVYVNFDSLFPKIGLQNVLEHCVQIQYEFDLCSGQNMLDKYDLALFVDMIVGKLFHVQYCLKKMIDSAVLIKKEDVQYVCKVLQRIASGYKKLYTENLPKQKVHIETLLDAVRDCLLAFE